MAPRGDGDGRETRTPRELAEAGERLGGVVSPGAVDLPGAMAAVPSESLVGTAEYWPKRTEEEWLIRKRVEAERDALRAALAELVTLKDMDLRTEAILADIDIQPHETRHEWQKEYRRLRNEYRRRKPAAWAAARAVLAAAQQD